MKYIQDSYCKGARAYGIRIRSFTTLGFKALRSASFEYF